MVYYHLQHYFLLDDAWFDLPHCNCGCSTSKSDVLEVFDYLMSLTFTRTSQYRIVVSGRDSKLRSYCRSKPVLCEPSYFQLSLF